MLSPARFSSRSPPTRWSGGGASRADPLALEGMPERFLPECAFRGRQNKKLQFAVLAAAALRGGAEPDLLDEVVWWQTDDFWQYGLYAAVAYLRAAASRADVPVGQVCQDLASARMPWMNPRPRRGGASVARSGKLRTWKRADARSWLGRALPGFRGCAGGGGGGCRCALLSGSG